MALSNRQVVEVPIQLEQFKQVNSASSNGAPPPNFSFTTKSGNSSAFEKPQERAVEEKQYRSRFSKSPLKRPLSQPIQAQHEKKMAIDTQRPLQQQNDASLLANPFLATTQQQPALFTSSPTSLLQMPVTKPAPSQLFPYKLTSAAPLFANTHQPLLDSPTQVFSSTTTPQSKKNFAAESNKPVAANAKAAKAPLPSGADNSVTIKNEEEAPIAEEIKRKYRLSDPSQGVDISSMGVVRGELDVAIVWEKDDNEQFKPPVVVMKNLSLGGLRFGAKTKTRAVGVARLHELTLEVLEGCRSELASGWMVQARVFDVKFKTDTDELGGTDVEVSLDSEHPVATVFNLMPTINSVTAQVKVYVRSLWNIRVFLDEETAKRELKANAKLVVEGQTLYVSKEFLSIYSTALAKQFAKSDDKEPGLLNWSVQLNSWKLEDVFEFLWAIHPPQRPLGLHNVAVVLALARKLGCRVLIEAAESFLIETPLNMSDTDRVVQFVQLADQHNLPLVLERVMPLLTLATARRLVKPEQFNNFKQDTTRHALLEKLHMLLEKF